MKGIIAICTYILGVCMEYVLVIELFNMNGELIDYLFLFGILVMPGLFLFIIPLTNVVEYIHTHYLILAILYILVGASIATTILMITIPLQEISDLFHMEYLFFILNGSWFSVLYYMLFTLQRIIYDKKIEYKKAI